MRVLPSRGLTSLKEDFLMPWLKYGKQNSRFCYINHVNHITKESVRRERLSRNQSIANICEVALISWEHV